MALPRLKLYTKVLLALALGTIFGLLANRLQFSGLVIAYVKPLGTGFVRLISMVVVPLVFASLLVGTTSLKDLKSLGRIGVKTVYLTAVRRTHLGNDHSMIRYAKKPDLSLIHI